MKAAFEYTWLDDNTVAVFTRCSDCGHVNRLEMPAEYLDKLADPSVKIQDSVPKEFTATQREMLMAPALCAKCQEDVFGRPDEEEDA